MHFSWLSYIHPIRFRPRASLQATCSTTPSASCPLDASLVPILAYLLMNGDEGARDQLRREMAAAGEQMGQIAPAGVPSHFYGLVLGAHNVVAFGDYLGTYLRILKKNPRGIGQHRGGVGLSGGQAW